jgi:hypothetical protein
VLAFPHFGFLPYAEGSGEEVPLIDNVADPMHGEFRENNGGGAFRLSFRDVWWARAVLFERKRKTAGALRERTSRSVFRVLLKRRWISRR